VSFRNRIFPNAVPEGEDEEETPATPPEAPPTVNPVRRRSIGRSNTSCLAFVVQFLFVCLISCK